MLRTFLYLFFVLSLVPTVSLGKGKKAEEQKTRKPASNRKISTDPIVYAVEDKEKDITCYVLVSGAAYRSISCVKTEEAPLTFDQ